MTADSWVKICCDLKNQNNSCGHFKLTPTGHLKAFHTNHLNSETLLFLQKYLPYALLPLKAKRLGRAISVTHFAQTLDAKIATLSGDSKWIGNAENLTHAHRMRALCSGVLVGCRTVEFDNPKLTVRHVVGPNPTKIILGSPKKNLTDLVENTVEEKIVIFGKLAGQEASKVAFYPLPYDVTTAIISPQAILEKLFELGIETVYIEGGAKTTSNFLNAGAVDVLQLHFAPLIFGSGKTSIELPSIDMVKEAIQFSEYHFLPFGDSMMFTGFLP
ncbi:MAG: RibD family protein [Bacteroidota bacterium]